MIPRITTEQMIEVDRLMIEVYKIELIQMMENAGRCLALTAKRHFFRGEIPEKKLIVLAGTGGNGGGAMVAARRLASWGAKVEVYLTSVEKLTPIPRHQYEILLNMGIAVKAGEIPSDDVKADLILDGIIGYSLRGNPRGIAKQMIKWANDHQAPILALDTPSGISLTEGEIFDPVIHAEATLTLALPKVGLFREEVKLIRGALYLGDISVPPELYAQSSLGIELGPIFGKDDVLRIEPLA
ncbi:MAG: NAD(P)H-hydrate epimerase [Bacteroidia bacterium]|nr:NAD(P)H-hydrate epimerase [Bacteroidia bacterium]